MKIFCSVIAAAAFMAASCANAQVLITSLGTSHLNLAGYNGEAANLPGGVSAAFIAGDDATLRERGFSENGTNIKITAPDTSVIGSGGIWGWGTATGNTAATITESTLAWQGAAANSSNSYTVTYQNSTSSVLTGLAFGFTAYQWRRSTGTRLSEVVLTSSLAGFAPFTFAGTGSASSTTGRTFGEAAPTGFAADQNYFSTVAGLNVAPGSTFSFTFTFNRDGAVAGSGTAQGLAIGNIFLSSVPEPTGLILVSGSLIGGVVRRRRV